MNVYEAYIDGFQTGWEMDDDQWIGFEIHLYGSTLPRSWPEELRHEATILFVDGVRDGFRRRHGRWPSPRRRIGGDRLDVRMA